MLLAAVAVAACGGSSPANATASNTAASNVDYAIGPAQSITTNAPTSAPKPTDGGTLVVDWDQEPPCLTSTWVENGYLTRQVLDQLVATGPDGKIVPWVATSWTISPDGLVYTFNLKPNIKFTDGTPLNAQAVAQDFTYWFTPTDTATYNGGAAARIGNYLKSWKATGPLTFQVTLKSRYSYFLNVLGYYSLGLHSPTSLKRGQAANCEDPIGSGAFYVVKWNHGQDVILKRNPNYNSAPADAEHQGPAYLNEIIWRFVDDDSTRWAALQTGEANVIYNVPAVDWTAAKANYEVEEGITGGTLHHLLFASTWGPFKDVRVRQAFAYGFDGPSDVKAAYQGQLAFDGNYTSPSTPNGYEPSLTNPFPYSPATANKLLDEAGWTGRNSAGYRTKDGQPLVIRFVYAPNAYDTSDDVDLYQLIQADEKKVGIDVQLIPVPPSSWFSAGWTSGGQNGKWDLESVYDVKNALDNLQDDWNPVILGAPNKAEPVYDPRVTKLIGQLVGSTDPAQQASVANQIDTILVKQDTYALGLTVLPVTLAIGHGVYGVWEQPDVQEPVFEDAYLVK